MEDIKRIYLLLLKSEGLKIREIANELGLEKAYVAELLFSSETTSYWYQDNNSLWYAIEGAIQDDKPKEDVSDTVIKTSKARRFDRFLQENNSSSLRHYLDQIAIMPSYSNKEVIELLIKYRQGDLKVRDIIVRGYLKLVVGIAHFYRNKGVSFEDLIQEGNIGLLTAIDKFDTSIQYSFYSYAQSWILQRILFAVDSYSSVVRFPLSQLFVHRKIKKFVEKYEQINEYRPPLDEIELERQIDNTTLESFINTIDNVSELTQYENDLDNLIDEESQADDIMMKEALQYEVSVLIDSLPYERIKDIIRSFYGIGTDERNLEEIGNSLGLTRERVRQIKEKTIRELRGKLKYKKYQPLRVVKQTKGIDFNKIRTQVERDKKTNMKVDKPTPKLIIYPKPVLPTTTRDENNFIKVERVLNVRVGCNYYGIKGCCSVKEIYIKGSRFRVIVKYGNGISDIITDERYLSKIAKYRVIEPLDDFSQKKNTKPLEKKTQKLQKTHKAVVAPQKTQKPKKPIKKIEKLQSVIFEETDLIKVSDLNKLGHVFDGKATSYKFFWFMSIIQIYKETEVRTILFKQILIKMVANAWKYVFVENAKFPSIDQLPKYLNAIYALDPFLNITSDREAVERGVNVSFQTFNPIIAPLLKNVPYRFLSPWIPFTSNEDVIEKSSRPEINCIYSLRNDSIVINESWGDFILGHYDKIYNFIERELRAYLNL